MKPLALTRENYAIITRHSLETFPDECCGLIVRRPGGQDVVPVTNVQNDKHAQYPASFPRTAATAYVMGPEAVPVLLAHDRNELVIEAFYHSHPQQDASFSVEDRERAILGGEPSYPDAGYVVISVRNRRVEGVKAFRWNTAARDFIQTSFEVL
jgi:proteasome lid subunit RPN8/RPN11